MVPRMASTDDLHRRVARILMIGFEGMDAVPAEAQALIDAGVFGAILFKRNVGTRSRRRRCAGR